jgi:hypothetical protein
MCGAPLGLESMCCDVITGWERYVETTQGEDCARWRDSRHIREGVTEEFLVGHPDEFKGLLLI